MSSRMRGVALGALLFLLGCQALAVNLMSLPLNRVIELRYCQDFYMEHSPSNGPVDGNVPEHMCKLDSIQQKLAWLQGMIETLHVICG